MAAIIMVLLGASIWMYRSRQLHLAEGLERQQEAMAGLVNFLSAPTKFQLACAQHVGRIIGATVEGDRLIIEVEYARRSATRRATLTGNVDRQGVFTGTYQTHLPGGRISAEIRLDFEEDGSAQGINPQWDGAISIEKS